MPPGVGASPPDPPPLRISGYAPGTFALFIITRFRSFYFEQFFLGRSVANLMMLTTIYVRLLLNCFLLKKFYLHYALCDFDSML